MDRTTRGTPWRIARQDIARLIGGVWLVAFAVLAAGAATSPLQPSGYGLARAAVLAAIGAGLSFLLWLGWSRLSGPGGLRAALLLMGIALAIAAHVQADLGVARLLRALLDVPMPRVVVAGDGPARALLMRLVAETSVVVFAAAQVVFGLALMTIEAAVERRERDRQLDDARAAATGARLAALRHQLNPHFMFNTLNAIGSLVETGRTREAGEMIDRLSTFLRATLGADGAPDTPLDEELAMIEAYLDIEAVRFRDRLSVVVDVPEALRRARVPTFVLQPLVENAMRHAVARSLRPVTVTLSASALAGDLLIEVVDDGAGHGDAGPPGAGVGLRNVRDRLALLYGPAGRLEAARHGQGFRAAIRLPFVVDPIGSRT